MAREIGLTLLGPIAGAGDDGEGFFAGFGGFEGGFHIFVGLRKWNGDVFFDGISEDLAVAALDGDFGADLDVGEIFENADFGGATVVTVEDHNFAATWGARLVIPTNIEDAGRGVEFAGSFNADRKNTGVFDADGGDGEIARLVGGNVVGGDFGVGDFGFVDILSFSGGSYRGAFGASFGGDVVAFPDGDFEKKATDDEEKDAVD